MLSAVEFLRRVTPQTGNFFSIQWKGSGSRGLPLRSYPVGVGASYAQAVNDGQYASRTYQADCYFALASFSVGNAGTTRSGRPCIRASRKQENVHSLRAFAIDGDVVRPDDKKSNAFVDRRAALDWLGGFTQASGVPWPNVIVNSGWGYHWYWTFELALARDQWQRLADAFSAALQKHGYAGDLQRTIDSASILRLPETLNYKVKDQPKPVRVIQANLDFARADIEGALAPYVGLTRARKTGSGPGPRPGHIPPIGEGANLNAAAHAGVEYPKHSFKRISERCAQLSASLAKGGEGDSYPRWLTILNLGTFCEDGREYAHLISKDDPRYTPENTDKYFDQFTAEIKAKSLGPPLCATFNQTQSGICQKCPHWEKNSSPATLDVESNNDPNELPYNYQRADGRQGRELQRYSGTNGEAEWKQVIIGDFHTPFLDKLPTGGYQLSFIYEVGNRRESIVCKNDEVVAQNVGSFLAKQGISVDVDNARQVGKFIVAWINKLRHQQAERAYRVRAYGWSFDEDGKHVGVVVAGDHYKCDGTTEFVPGGDPKINAMYRPMGSYENWRHAAALFEGKRPDLQIPFGISLASALIALCGDVRGMSFNLFSSASGIGKTSALRVAQAIWGSVAAMQTMADTPNAAMKLLSEPRILVRFWDEMSIRKGCEEQWVEMIFTIPQGKERARMQADTTLRETGEWEALMCMTSNRSYADILAASNGSSDSGQLRLLEIELVKQKVNFNPEAGPLIKLCESNYGHAGRMFLRYVAQNLPKVQDMLKRTMAGLSVKLKVRQEERYYLTAIATILVSAAIAREMNLFDFDIRGIQRVLQDAFYKSRDTRASTAVVQTSGDYDIESLLGDFQQELADYRLRTNVFSYSGQTSPEIRVAPTRQEVHIQIAEQAAVMRVNRKRLTDWLLKRGLPAYNIIKKLRQSPWNATECKATIGAGTAYAGGQIYCLDIPLVGPLANYVTDAMRQPEKRELPEGLRV